MALQYLANKCVANQQPTDQHSTGEQDETTNADQAATAHAAESRASKALVSEAAAASLSRALIQDLSEKVSHLQLALDALAVTQAGANISFPKFKELVTVLTEMQGKRLPGTALSLSRRGKASTPLFPCCVMSHRWQPSAFTPSLDEQQTASAERTPI